MKPPTLLCSWLVYFIYKIIPTYLYPVFILHLFTLGSLILSGWWIDFSNVFYMFRMETLTVSSYKRICIWHWVWNRRISKYVVVVRPQMAIAPKWTWSKKSRWNRTKVPKNIKIENFPFKYDTWLPYPARRLCEMHLLIRMHKQGALNLMSCLLFQAYLFANIGDSLCAYVVFHWAPPEGLGPAAAGNWITRTCCRPVHLGLRVFTLLWRRVFFPLAGIEVGRGRLRSPPCRVQSAGRQHSVALWWPKNTHTAGEERKIKWKQAKHRSPWVTKYRPLCVHRNRVGAHGTMSVTHSDRRRQSKHVFHLNVRWNIVKIFQFECSRECILQLYT